MTLVELNEILNLFGLNATAYVNDIYFSDIEANSNNLDVFYYKEEDGYLDRPIRTSNKKELLNGHRFYAEGLLNDFVLGIKYDEKEDKYDLLYLDKMNRRYIEDPDGDYINMIFLDSKKKYKRRDYNRNKLECFNNCGVTGINYFTMDENNNTISLNIQNINDKKSKLLFEEFNSQCCSDALTYSIYYNDGLIDYLEDSDCSDFNYVYNSDPIITKLLDLYGSKIVEKEIIDPSKCFRLKPMLPTEFSPKQREEIKQKEKEIFEKN